MSADERKRKIEALGASGVRRNPDGSVELVPGGAADSGGGLGASSRVAAAKALLQRAGMGSGKSHKKEKKHKKENKHKKEKKTSKKASKKRKRDRGTSDCDESASVEEVGKARRWKSRGKALKPSSKDDQAWSAPPGPDVNIETISDDDYYLKNREFAAWLRRDRGAFFTDLRAEEARRAFATFVEEWNNRRLPAEFYEEGGIVASGRR
jgi:hypothetical protein